MFLFKYGLFVLPSSWILSLCYQVTIETKILEYTLLLLYVASGAIAGNIVYDRHQHINILGSLTTNPNVTSFANKISSFSVTSMFIGLLVHLCLFLFKVDMYSITALNIFVCAFCTLYMWMQGIVTVYFSTLFFDKALKVLRQGLATASCVVVVAMASLGTVATLLPRGTNAYNGANVCLYITSLCNYIIASLFTIFILSFEKDYKYFAAGLRTDLLLDDGCSYDDVSASETYTPQNVLSRSQDLRSRINIIKGNITAMTIS